MEKQENNALEAMVLSKEKEQGMGRERDSRSTICQSLCQETEIDGKPDRLSAFEKPTSQ